MLVRAGGALSLNNLYSVKKQGTQLILEKYKQLTHKMKDILTNKNYRNKSSTKNSWHYKSLD